MSRTYFIKELVGHSLAKTYLIEKDGKLLVRKRAEVVGGLGAEKLEAQYLWLKNLPRNFKDKFPEVVSFEKRNGYFSYDMEYYELPSLGDLFHSGLIGPEETYNLLEKIFFYCFNKLFQSRAVPGTQNYLEEKILSKLEKRIEMSQHISKDFNEFNKNKIFWFNGKKVRNFRAILEILRGKKFHDVLNPTLLGTVHGDLTFSNVLTDGTRFILIDPQGEDCHAVFYDLAKTYQSMVKNLEPLMDGKIDIELHKNVATSSYLEKGTEISQSYEKGFYDLVETRAVIVSTERYWREKTLFFAGAHFIGAVPFRLNDGGIETGALAYLTGLELLETLINS